MTESHHSQAAPPRRSHSGKPHRRAGLKRWSRRIALTLSLLVIAFLAFGWWLTQPKRLASLIEHRLAERTGASVHIERAHLSLTGKLTLDQVRLAAPGGTIAAQHKHPLFRAPKLHLSIDPVPLLLGDLRFSHVRLRRPTVHLTQNRDTGRFNFQRLPMRDNKQSLIQPDLPSVTIEAGRLQLGEIANNQYHTRGSLDMAGAFKRKSKASHKYSFVLRNLVRSKASTQPSTVAPTKLTGTLDAKARAINLTLHRFRFEGPQRNLLPARFRKWWDRLNPTGALPTVRARLAADDTGALTLKKAHLRVEGLALTLPFDRTPPRYMPRMRDVAGRFILTRDKITIPKLTGRVEGIRYAMNAKIHGYAPNAPFTLHARTAPFTIPRNPPFLHALPRVVRDQYDHFDPTGRFRATVRLTRNKPGGDIQHQGLVRVLSASMRFHKFPYPVQGMHGKMHFNNDRVEVNLTGYGPSGGDVRVHGLRIQPPRDGGGSNLTLVARNVPLDSTLLNAMKPKERKPLKLFFSRQARRQLLERNALHAARTIKPEVTPNTSVAQQRGASNRTSQLSARGAQSPSIDAFRLGGRIPYIKVQFHRPVGDDKRPVVAATLHTRGLRGVFKHWPYPMTSTGGRIFIRDGRISVDNLTLQGLSGARATIDGYVTTPVDQKDNSDEPAQRGLGQFTRSPDSDHSAAAAQTGTENEPSRRSSTEPTQAENATPPAMDAANQDTKGVIPHLRIQNLALPIDRLLTASLPAPQHTWLKRMNLAGTLAGDGRIYKRADGEIDFTLNGNLRDGSAHPFNGDYALSKIRGDLRLSRTGIRLNNLTANHQSTELNLTGQVQWSQPGIALTLKGEASHLHWHKDVLDLLPSDYPARAKLMRLHQKYKPAGTFDATFKLNKPAPQPPDNQPAGEQETVTQKAHDTTAGAQSNDRPWADTDYTISVRPKDAAFTFRDHRFTFTDMTGAVRLTPGKLEFNRFGAHFPYGRVNVSGLVTLASGETAVRFSGKGSRIGPSLRTLLPQTIAQAIDRFEFQGGFKVKSGRLHAGPNQRFELDTEITLNKAQADFNAPLTDIHGTVNLTVRRPEQRDWPRVNMTLNARKLRVWNRPIRGLRMQLSSSVNKPALVRAQDVHGKMAGGRLIGKGMVDLDSGAYRANLSLHDVGMEALLGPGTNVPGEPTAHPRSATNNKDTNEKRTPRRDQKASPDSATLGNPAPNTLDNLTDQQRASAKTPTTQPNARLASKRGHLTAHLRLADDGDPNTPRRGRGALQVRSARLYRQPVVLALLQATNVSWPTARAFDRASARFFLQGDDVRLNLVRFEAPTVAITGRGTMHLPAQKLDLTMFCRNPSALDLGALSEALNVFKDQLVCIRVNGTLADPVAEHVSFQGFRDTWQAIMEGEGLPTQPNEPRPLPFRP